MSQMYGNELVFLFIVAVTLSAYWACSLLQVQYKWALLQAILVNGGILLLFWVTGFAGAGEPYSAHASSFLLWIDARVTAPDGPFFIISLIVTANLAVTLLVKIYRAACFGIASSDEKEVGFAGIRAWLSPSKTISVVLIAILAGLAFDCSYIGTLILGFAVLLAYPLLRIALRSFAAGEVPPPQAPAEERERVLTLVEAGKITAEEAAELLTALAQSQSATNESASAMTGPKRLMLAGAALLFIGFLLPWFVITKNNVRDFMNSVQQNIPQQNNGVMDTAPAQVADVTLLSLRGGDVRDGLGWVALIAGLLSATAPYLWPLPATDIRHRNMAFGALIIGSIVLIYLLSGSFNSITNIEAGFILSLIAYGLLWIGAVRQYATRSTRFAAALAIT